MRLFFSIIIIFLLSSCFLNTWDNRIILVNNTNKKILFRSRFKQRDDFKLDTINCQQTTFYDIPPKSEHRINNQVKLDTYFKQHPNNVFRLYIINEDSLIKYGACKIIENEIFAKRFDLNFDDMVKLNWRVEYKE